jgi:hypothetical protein
MIKSSVVACMLVFGLALQVAALADQPGPDWMPVEQVKQKLLSLGYASIIKIEVEDGHWDGEGMKNGEAMQFDLDPMTGDILGEVEK